MFIVTSAKSRIVRVDESEQVSEEKRVSEFEQRYKFQRIGFAQENKEGMKGIDEKMKEVPQDDRNEFMKDNALQNSSNEQDNIVKKEVVDEDEDQPMKEVEFESNVKDKREQVKSMYRFSNRLKLGSFLSISRKDYELLQKGYSIQCVNTNMNSIIMTIRAVQGSSLQHDKTKVKCDHMDWNDPSKTDLNEHANEVSPTKSPFTCRTEEVGNTGETKKRTNISNKSHTSKRKRKRRSSLTISIRKMKTTKPRLLTKHSRRKKSSYRKPIVSSSPNWLAVSKTTKDRKRKDFTPPSGCYNRQGK